ncbi:MAG: glutathione S-transferase N-terminal domain-containing protein, partial [Chlamydiota bacterium]
MMEMGAMMMKFVMGVVFLCASSFVHSSQNPHDSVWLASTQKHKLVLYYASYCPYSQKVLTYLEHMNWSIPMKNVENSRKAKDELKTVGGKLQVPCLVIDGKALYESDAIIQWLSE